MEQRPRDDSLDVVPLAGLTQRETVDFLKLAQLAVAPSQASLGFGSAAAAATTASASAAAAAAAPLDEAAEHALVLMRLASLQQQQLQVMAQLQVMLTACTTCHSIHRCRSWHACR